MNCESAEEEDNVKEIRKGKGAQNGFKDSN